MIITSIRPTHYIVEVTAKPNANIKGLRGALQKKFHEQDIYGLEFWFNSENDGEYVFDVFSNHGNNYTANCLGQYEL